MTPARPKAPTVDLDAALEELGAVPEELPVGLVEPVLEPVWLPVLLPVVLAPVGAGAGSLMFTIRALILITLDKR
jgi:hypothetical protein